MQRLYSKQSVNNHAQFNDGFEMKTMSEHLPRDLHDIRRKDNNASLNPSTLQMMSEMNQLQVEIHALPPELRDTDVGMVGTKPRLSLESGDSMFYQHGTQDSYSSGYSGMSESPSSANDGLYEDNGQDNLSGYLNDYSEVGSCIQRIIRQKIRPNESELADTNTDDITSVSALTHTSSLLESEDLIYLEKCDKLPDMRWLPWTENEVLHILKEGRTKHMSGHITVEMMHRLSYLLQRPLIRIAKEAMKLSTKLNICTKHEIEASSRCVLSRSVSHSCQMACAKAVTLYSMSGDALKQSKGARCGLHFSVGKFQRWMIHAQLADRIHEFAAIYLAACMENLLEEIVLRALCSQELGDSVWNLDVLEYGITHNAELWGTLQPYEHLVCGRNAYGVATLPTDFEKVTDGSRDRAYEQETLEECMLATCFGSVQELGDLVYEVMTFWYTAQSVQSPGGGPACSKRLPHAVYWSTEALRTLYRYTRCHDTHCDDALKRKHFHLSNDRTYNLMPPLHCWVKTALAFTEHRGCCMVTSDDVARTADIILPANICHSVKHYGSDSATCTSKTQSAAALQQESQRELLFRVAMTGQHQLMTETLRDMAARDRHLLNMPDQQGLTLLMKAVIQGNEEAVLCLLNHSAYINAKIGADTTLQQPCIHPMTRGWSALHLAVLFHHARIVQHLLARGSQVDGRVRSDEENVVLTPLQLACAAGNLELVSILIEHGADPYLHTTPKNGVSLTYNRGGLSAFSMAAMHGHRDVLKYLLSCPPPSLAESMMSLEEILQEGGAKDSDYLPKSKYHIYEEIPDDVYQTIDEPSDNKSRKCSSKHSKAPRTSTPLKAAGRGGGAGPERGSSPRTSVAMTRSASFISKLTKPQFLVLQDALYNAAECGFLEVASDLHRMGVPWSLFSWGRCLEYAFEAGRNKYLEALLNDFEQMYTQDDVTVEFVQHVMPLMFDMLRLNKDGPLKLKLSNILSSVHGKEPLPKLKRVEDSFYSIDPVYLNNPDHSDVKFIVEGQTIHAHRSVLMHSSPRFNKMLTPMSIGDNVPVIQLNDIRYKIFQYILKYLYCGGTQSLNVESKDIFELYAAARHYKLEGLKRHCETLCVDKMHLDNAMMVYKNAKLHQAHALAGYCDGFFLQNMTHLLSRSESFHKLLYSRKRQNYNLLGGMLGCLTLKLNAKLESRRKLAPSVRI